MARDRQQREKSEVEELREQVMVLESEIERLSSPPFTPATIIDINRKSVRVSADGKGVFEVPCDPSSNGNGNGNGCEYKKGERVILNPMNLCIVGKSDFPVIGGPTVVVDSVMGDRIRVQNKGDAQIVLSALDGVRPGDEVRLDPSGSIAVEKLDRKKNRYALEEVIEAPWEGIGGLSETIQIVKQEIEEPFIHREVYARYGRKPAKGILLYGPPGCGKTRIARSIAWSLAQCNGASGNGDRNAKRKGYFIRVNGPEILEKWLGNTESNIRRIYESAREVARETGEPTIVFIDEAESVLKSRGSGISTDVYDSIVPQFLAEMNGLNDGTNVITVLATNREDMLDPAVLRSGRIDRRILVPRPNKEGAAEIFTIYLNGKPLHKELFGLRSPDSRKLAEKLSEIVYADDKVAYEVVDVRGGSVIGKFNYKHLVSGAMIESIVNRAATYAIGRELKNKGEKGMTESDLVCAVQDEFRDYSGFEQTVVKEDWEAVFGSDGRRYLAAHNRGILQLNDMIKRGN